MKLGQVFLIVLAYGVLDMQGHYTGLQPSPFKLITMNHPENLHRDYVPHNVVTHFKSKVVSGIIVLICFYKTKNLTTFERILKFFAVTKTRDVYYWLPFKALVEGSNKYGVIGPKSRDPYANQWFEIKEHHDVYKQGLDEYGRLHTYGKQVKTLIPFNEKDMLILTRKAVIKMLDEFVFAKKQQHRK